ncbi:MAG: hypothetical protein HeimC3_22160 [Candidatus Heimdallarchaeota archaeon LC_3]|nr:MAG: hypothetical protein HeimC3_22160 [Candidatus Heimdallarchaeota archaeon LC_3]
MQHERRIANLKTWQKAFLVSFLILIPLSIGIGWILVSPIFLSIPKAEEKDETDDQAKQEEDANNQTVLLTGQFNIIDSAHYGSGMVSIIEEENRSINLYFTNVDIATGPDLLVYLSSKGSFSGTGDSPGTYYDLGSLEFNEGNFTMKIPQEVNITDYHSVLIWCEPFSVVFTWAFLQP